MGPLDNGQVVGVYWYNGTKAESVTEGWFANRTLGCFPGTPRTEYRGGASNVFWAAVHNQFFTLAVMTSTNEPASEVIARRIDLPRPSKEEVAANSKTVAEPHGYQTSLLFPAVSLPPGQSFERHFSIYAGPKEYRTLAQIAAQFDNNIDLVMGFGGFFGFFAKFLLLSMNWLHHQLGLAYGTAIIVITVIIKVVFWPLTKASTRSMKRMQALQPQMKAIQDKYKDEPAKMQQKLMAFMKENKVSPLGGCLPMVLQIPVFFGFYTMIRSAIELRGAHFLWACDLSKPDTVFMIPGFNFPLNPLPLIMGATMLWQTSLTPVSPGMDPGQQKIMKYMPLMMVVFLYNFSAGLALYWTVQNLLTIAQMKLTKTSAPTPATVKPPAPVAPQKKKK
jgi:YidC/Oxa1 family membrane protein insertase